MGAELRERTEKPLERPCKVDGQIATHDWAMMMNGFSYSEDSFHADRDNCIIDR